MRRRATGAIQMAFDLSHQKRADLAVVVEYRVEGF